MLMGGALRIVSLTSSGTTRPGVPSDRRNTARHPRPWPVGGRVQTLAQSATDLGESMRRKMTTAASIACIVGLMAACGSGSEPLTQEQASKAILTDEDFPLDGFTRGQQQDGLTDKSDDQDESSSKMLENSDASQECKDAFKAIDEFDAEDDGKAASKVDFTADQGGEGGAGAGLMGPKSVEVQVQAWEKADEAFDKLEDLPDKCGKVTISDPASGGQASITFSEPELPKADDARGVKMEMEVMGQKGSLTMAGLQDGDNVALMSASELSDDEAGQVLSAQFDKMKEAGE